MSPKKKDITYIVHRLQLLFLKAVVGITILRNGPFLMIFRISMGHSLTFFVKIYDFNLIFSAGM